MDNKLLIENIENGITFENAETTENIIVDNNISATQTIQNTYYVVSALTFLIFGFYMYRYLKAVFKRRN